MQGMRRNKGLTGLALVAILALTLSVTVGTAATAAGGSAAEIAKKKKCKKKKGPDKPAPLVRATITWSNADSPDGDLDLFAFDASGGIARPGSTTIPNTTTSADVTGQNGSETFTDLAPKPLRAFSFGVCYQVGGSQHAPFTITYVTADGQSHTENRDPGDSGHFDFPGGPPIPAGYCPN